MEELIKIKIPEKSTTVLVKVTDNQDILNTCNYAIIPVTKELRETIKPFHELFAHLQTSGITWSEHSTYYWDLHYLNEFHDGCFDDEPVLSERCGEAIRNTKIAEAGVLFIEDDVLTRYRSEMPGLRIDGSKIHVGIYGFWFTAHIKHTDIVLTTETIPFDFIGL